MLLSIILAFLKETFYFIHGFLGAFYRDLSGLPFLFHVETSFKEIQNKNLTLADYFNRYLKKNPNKPCILFNDETWTYQDIENYSNKIANLFMKRFKLKKGDCVALLLTNKPQYAATWLGLSKIGVVSALINTNLKNQSLIHSITVSKAKFLIYDYEFKQGDFLFFRTILMNKF
jgi:solute carrier family 27 (fatty acid transporter), member 1/4